jgi:tyrosine-protein phosphatase YwqE
MYFPFSKNKDENICLKVDIHSHLIPAIDDGSQSMEESLHLLKGLEAQGYQKVITTPHIMADTYVNTPKNILAGLKNLILAAKDVGIGLSIEAAAEYYLDENFLTHLHSDDTLLIAGKYLLFETSYLAKPLQFDEMVYEILALGYTPVFAHPERYRYISNMKKEYQALKEKGILFQVNINSFGGHYGKDAKAKANYLSKQGMIDFLGSDVHHIKQVETLVKIKKTAQYRQIFKHNTILNNML